MMSRPIARDYSTLADYGYPFNQGPPPGRDPAWRFVPCAGVGCQRFLSDDEQAEGATECIHCQKKRKAS